MSWKNWERYRKLLNNKKILLKKDQIKKIEPHLAFLIVKVFYNYQNKNNSKKMENNRINKYETK